MNGLAQYGVGRGSLIGTIVIDTNNVAAPANWDANETADRDQIKDWLKGPSPILSPSPAQNETNLLYFIFLPRATTLTNGRDEHGNPVTDVGGWHSHSKHNSNSQKDDLFWGLVRTDHANISTERNFVDSLAPLVSHELAEAFTDRDGHGFFDDSSSGCENADKCENLTGFEYRGWHGVEQYWSNWDNTCIRGDQPVSVKRFLREIGVDGSTGLRQLQSGVINVDFVASKM